MYELERCWLRQALSSDGLLETGGGIHGAVLVDWEETDALLACPIKQYSFKVCELFYFS